MGKKLNIDSFEDLISENILEELIQRRSEYPQLDYKITLDITKKEGILNITKDGMAMANLEGGYIVLGVDNDYNPVGLPDDFHIDEADLRSAINAYCVPKIQILYKEFIRKKDGELYALIYIYPSDHLIFPKKDGNYPHQNVKGKLETKSVFNLGHIYFRDGSSSKRIENAYELEKVLKTKRGFGTGDEKEIISYKKSLNIIPDIKKEELLSNIFPVINHPDMLWFASTNYRTKKELYDICLIKDEYKGITLSSFILKDKKLFTFSNLSNEQNNLRLFVKTDTISYLEKNDVFTNDDLIKYLVELYNLDVQSYCFSKDLYFNYAYHKFYFKLRRGKTRSIKWYSGKRTSTRNVVTYYDDDNFYAHQAVRIKFTHIEGTIFLLINPCWFFTVDGQTFLLNPDKVRSLSPKFESQKRNNHIRNDLNFWISYLRNDFHKIRLDGLDYKIYISSKPLITKLEVGIKND